MSLHTTRGIILHQTQYSETSVIVKVYTEAFGLCSFIFKGVRKTRHKTGSALLQPLSIVEIVFNRKENSDLQFATEIRISYPYSELTMEIKKITISMFISELLYKTLKEEAPNPDLFLFLFTSLQILDLTQEPVANFPVWFSLQLTRFLGFLPLHQEQADQRIFNLQDGNFQQGLPEHPHFAELPYTRHFRVFSAPGFREYSNEKLSSGERSRLLEYILEYYKLHQHGFGNMKSPSVLHEVLS